MNLNYLFLKNVSYIFRRKSEDRHLEIFTMKRSVGLRQPRLDCAVVTNRTTKGSVLSLSHPFIVIQMRI
jgi:hypothetical protein